MSKKGFLVVLCQFIFFTGISAQSAYNRFVVDGVGWVVNENFCSYEGGPCDAGDPSQGSRFNDTYYYKLDGDTLVDSVYYEKLYLSFCTNSCINCGPPNGPPFTAGCTSYQLVALLTEDTINKIVYSKSVYSVACWNFYDSLFMNFSLGVGDSENMVYNLDWIQPNICDTNEFIVDSINYTGFQNYQVKTWYIRNTSDVGLIPNTDIQLYEGIGYSFGFNLLYNPGDGTTYARQLIKYCPAGDNSCASPYRPNGISDIPESDMGVVVSPNPASDFLSIKSLNATISKVEIMDINGRTMISSPFNQLSISSLAPAMYILQIHTNLGIAYKKFVKM